MGRNGVAGPRRADLLMAASLGAAISFPWEMAQSLLYRGGPSFTWKQHLGCCVPATLLDGLCTAVIFFIGSVLFRDSRWTQRRPAARLLLIAVLGATGAVATERIALRLDWWQYGPAMPLVPGLGVGVAPLAQFLMLPPLVLFVLLPRYWQYEVRQHPPADPGRKDDESLNDSSSAVSGSY